MHLIPRDSFESCRIGLQVLDAILQLPIFFVEPLDLLLHLPRLQLRPAHRQHSVSPENILEQNQREARNQKPIRISAQEIPHLIAKATARLRTFALSRSAPPPLPLY